MRIFLIGLLIYLMYTVFKRMFMRPFKQGYANANKHRDDTYRPFSKKEGDVSIDYNPSRKKTKDDGIGEYVDYEEVD